MLLVLTLIAAASASDCPSPTSPAALDAALDATETTISAAPGEFTGLLAAADQVVACLATPVTPTQAAQLHRLHGIGAESLEELGGLPHFMAARAIEPDAPLAEGTDFSGTVAEEAYQSVDPSRIVRKDIDAVERGGFVLDGTPTLARAKDLPVVFQYEVDGAVTLSRWLAPGAPIPDLPIEPLAPTPIPESEDGAGLSKVPAPEPAPRVRAGRLWSGVGVGLLAAGLYAGSHVARGRFDELAPGAGQRGEAEGLQTATNAMTLGSGVALTASLTLVGTSFIPPRP
jgi:hypothetical protein